MDKKQIKPHDSFFKNLFSQKEHAMEFLAKTTPQEVVKNLNLNSLQLDTTDYVGSDLQEYFADVVYNCDYKFSENETKTIKISFLFEHKSYKEHIPHLQLNRYLLNIWDNQVKQANKDKTKFKDFRLQPIIPIIFYHGTTKWNKQPFESYFSGMNDFLINFLPKFDYHLVDMSDYPNAKITQLFNKKQLQVGLLLMKNIFYETSLLELLKDIFSTTMNFATPTQERQFYESIVHYIFYSKKNVFFTKITEIMETLQTHQSDNFVSIAESLELKGISRERKRIAFSMIQDNFTNERIMKLTGLSEQEINHLRTFKDFQNDLLN